MNVFSLYSRWSADWKVPILYVEQPKLMNEVGDCHPVEGFSEAVKYYVVVVLMYYVIVRVYAL